MPTYVSEGNCGTFVVSMLYASVSVTLPVLLPAVIRTLAICKPEAAATNGLVLVKAVNGPVPLICIATAAEGIFTISTVRLQVE